MPLSAHPAYLELLAHIVQEREEKALLGKIKGGKEVVDDVVVEGAGKEDLGKEPKIKPVVAGNSKHVPVDA